MHPPGHPATAAMVLSATTEMRGMALTSYEASIYIYIYIYIYFFNFSKEDHRLNSRHITKRGPR